jgi:hypothetical protein
MPGIEVSESGAIKFNGKAIKKFYVEDMDLLQGRYGLATNNINASDVATVQVLEHLLRTGAKPYCIDSVPIHGGLWVSVVGLVYIALSCAELAIATSATHPLVKTRDIKQLIAFKGRPTCYPVA